MAALTALATLPLAALAGSATALVVSPALVAALAALTLAGVLASLAPAAGLPAATTATTGGTRRSTAFALILAFSALAASLGARRLWRRAGVTDLWFAGYTARCGLRPGLVDGS
ncbi:MAG: hypothetical protein AAF547_19795 [Actinomycetota bacterium]